MKTIPGVRLILFLFILSSHKFIEAQDSIIRIQKDVLYVRGGTQEQQMDIYLPVGKNFPVVLYLHGGSLTSGDKSDSPYATIAINFAKNGIGFILVNYRLGPTAKWPAMAVDAASAFSWIKKNVAILNANPRKLFIVGHSSGALIASLLSTDEKYLQKSGCSLSDIAGCVAMGTMLNPSYDTDSISKDTLNKIWRKLRTHETYESLFETPDSYRDADPSRHITKNAPPFLILIAEEEQVNPPILEQANRFTTAMKNVGVQVQIEVLKNRKHSTAMNKMAELNDPTFVKIIEFIETH
jgi:acetyl esterase/lipase